MRKLTSKEVCEEDQSEPKNEGNCISIRDSSEVPTRILQFKFKATKQQTFLDTLKSLMSIGARLSREDFEEDVSGQWVTSEKPRTNSEVKRCEHELMQLIV